jgi:hypothetical protein
MWEEQWREMPRRGARKSVRKRRFSTRKESVPSSLLGVAQSPKLHWTGQQQYTTFFGQCTAKSNKISRRMFSSIPTFRKFLGEHSAIVRWPRLDSANGRETDGMTR